MAQNSTPHLGVSQPISLAAAETKDIIQTQNLENALREFNAYESEDELRLRLEVLRSLNRLIKEWVKQVTAAKLPAGETIDAGGKLFTFGSYRLGVHTSGADIDTLAVVPRHVERSDFFTTFYEMLNQDPNVTELHAVEEAFVPVIKLKYSGIELDILFARLASKEVPDDQSLSDDIILKNLDTQSIRSLNGCRVAEMLLKLVPNQRNFCTALRAIKLWAKNHGIYSNSMGFYGGVTWAILVARTCQLYPNAAPAKLVQKVFFIFSTWSFPHPVILKEMSIRPDLPALTDLVWDPRIKASDRYHLMPILTPAFPEQNSTYNVTKSTSSILIAEMCEGLEICEDVYKNKESWSKLFEEVNFFTRYKHYITLMCATSNEEETITYAGFLESKIRHLISGLERNPDIQLAHINPKKYKPTEKAKFDFTMTFRSPVVTLWFIGLEISKTAKNLDLTPEIHRFRTSLDTWGQTTRGIAELGVEFKNDLLYVKRNNLHHFISTADLTKGRRYTKPKVPPKTPASRTTSISQPPTPTTAAPQPNMFDSLNSSGFDFSDRNGTDDETPDVSLIDNAARSSPPSQVSEGSSSPTEKAAAGDSNLTNGMSKIEDERNENAEGMEARAGQKRKGSENGDGVDEKKANLSMDTTQSG